MRNEGLGSWPARRARKTPQRTALIHGDTSITYGELYERTTRLAHALRASGVRRGDRIAYLGPNHPSYLETLFAAGTLGAVFVPLNTRLAGPEIAYQLADSGAKALVYGPGFTGLVAGLPGDTDVRTYVETGTEYEALLAGAEAEPIDQPVTADDTCIIMYTSGTTGRPKGAMLTHGNIIWNAVNVLVDQDVITDERALVSAPLFHTAGLNMLTLPVLLKGGTCVLVEAFAPEATFDLIERHRITFMFGVPTMFDQVARHPRWADADLSSLRMLSCGGSPVPTPLIAKFQERGLTFLQGYGMTEAAPGTLFLDAEHAVSKAGSAGVPHFFSDVRVVRPDMTPVDVDEPGEVVVRGPHVMPGYWGLPEETAAVFADGWFRSGDAARVDEDGYVFIVDRIKDMIISGGENIYPAEIEDQLLAHPDVVECAVIGVPDDKWGEVPRAVVVPREGSALDADEVLASLAGRLAKYKIPKSVVIADELPRTASGKLLKARVRKRYGTNS
ncbi:o-succinylbenzoate--CoA ligase [Streptomyces europaeiscabiei]|uniref:O-succinylbenzoate--CoA ligase n=1 Tax=Streptomyces europaeiscabiei TaxID=146819 RepID=A0AAJ2PK44_9ACTN|nr:MULTISPECIES: o-succinylbenzoate--CoA ligase [Streptomyces]KFF95864.1 AMP-dependent synthetase [Streptomyces scabiei]MDX2759585.1 o-succinylbenzoate--CoA ligase [Streptomyces europaeiscabiei]MDX2767491.1 o-succinylbenzoate--CoA ligase [Streptomyces europaeiscabiei]MDX3129020.1 o-succinylbenzoate--CoA ligase [Streptomyces europaeiscabiei]MDX3665399.1 o-succinylbenzoate--CoA ligase [Streptomyces europaeiscabiei]